MFTIVTTHEINHSHSHRQVGRVRKTSARKREYHILFMVLTTAACYLLCWTPYGVVAMMATFGPPDIISPVASVVPSLLAKSSTVINPIIYILMNKQVRHGGDGGGVDKTTKGSRRTTW